MGERIDAVDSVGAQAAPGGVQDAVISTVSYLLQLRVGRFEVRLFRSKKTSVEFERLQEFARLAASEAYAREARRTFAAFTDRGAPPTGGSTNKCARTR